MEKYFNKVEFLKTPIGLTVKKTIDELDAAIIRRASMPRGYYNYTLEEGEVDKFLACWEVLKVVIKQLYGVEYCFTRTNEYYGLCTEDESDYLFKVDRDL